MTKITDEMVETVTREYRNKLGEARRDMTLLLSGEWKEKYGDTNRNPFAVEHYAMRNALSAALAQEGEAEPVADDVLLARVASIICEETCGLTSACKSREAARALFDKGYLSRAHPAPADAGVVERLREVRALFQVEYGEDGKIEAVAHGSKDLRKVVAILDAALRTKGGE